MNLLENKFRDLLFRDYKENLSNLFVGKREAVNWTNDNKFPPIHFLLQRQAEKKINAIAEDLSCLTLMAKELKLKKEGDSTTRIDLFGNSESSGLTIIELKKTKQTAM